MGYREDVAVAYASHTWEVLVTQIGSSFLTDDQRQNVIAFLDAADEHAVNEDGDHMLRWDSIKTSADDAQVLFDTLHNSMDDNYWQAIFLGEDGHVETHGSWYDNPFSLGVSHNLNSDTDGDEQWTTSGITLINSTPTIPAPATVPPTSKVINDHTCGCGNTACSKSEKSCWKCGAPIS
jgi:hypothetical protein